MTLAFALCYLILLAVHFLYALHCIRTNRVDLSIGAVRTPGAILLGLLILNGFSILAILAPSPGFVLANVMLHAILAADEVLRTLHNRLRWVFLVNHILWVALLLAWRMTIPPG